MSYGLIMKEYTISGAKANLYGALFVVPVLLLDAVPYILIWYDFGYGFPEGLHTIAQNNFIFKTCAVNVSLLLILFAVALFVGIVLHELIHGVCMAAHAKNGWKSVSFGFNIKALAPYSHCMEPLSPNAYRFTLVMPGILLGDIPVIISWFTGNILFLFFGILFCLGAVGDVIVLWLSRNITNGVIQDHPDKIGFVHIEE